MWTLLIIREAFFGTQRFSDFETNLGIAKNVLSERLAKLVGAGILKRMPMAGRGNPVAYTLTGAGRDLLPVLIALMQWGDRWISGGMAPIRILDRGTGEEIASMRVASRRGRHLTRRDLAVVPGPGADDIVQLRFKANARER